MMGERIEKCIRGYVIALRRIPETDEIDENMTKQSNDISRVAS